MSLLKIIAKVFAPPPPKPPPPPPKPPPPPPPPKPEPAEDLNAKIAAQRQQALQLKNKLERFGSNVPPALRPVVEFAEQALTVNASSELVRLIAQKNAPVLVLPPGSSAMPNVNLPADPEEYIAHSQLRENVSFSESPFTFGNDHEYGNNINDDSDDDFSSADVGNTTDENAFLDLNNEERGQIGSADAPVSYQFQNAEYGENGEMTKPPRLTYHIFYAFNDGPTPLGGTADGLAGRPIGDHEGDWERVTYELDPKTLEPTHIIASQHEGGERIGMTEKDAVTGRTLIQRDSATNRPLIYVAEGSHANYIQPGTDYPLPAGAADATAVDLNGDGRVNEYDGAVIFDTGRNLNEAASQPWYPEADSRGVRWGEIGALENETLVRDAGKLILGENNDPNAVYPSGPQGPSYDKGAVE